MMTPDGLSAYEHGIDLWQAIPLDKMKAKSDYQLFFKKRLPQLQILVAQKRSIED